MNKIALIKGGRNSENKISLLTAEACKNALNYLGHNFIELDIKDNFIPKAHRGHPNEEGHEIIAEDVISWLTTHK